MTLISKDVYVYKKEDKISYTEWDKEFDSYLQNALDIVMPGDKVVIKPNFVRQCSLKSSEWEHVITNPELIKIVLEKVIEKLNGNGEITILDAPQEDSDFQAILNNTGLLDIIKSLQLNTQIPIKCIDIRTEWKKTVNGVIVSRKKLKGDPKGYKTIDLNQSSCFYKKKCKDYYGADYDRDAAKGYHNEINNAYVISGSVLDCDVFINMPKLKTHKIGGMTCCLKNAIGIIGVKNCIPHHTLGVPSTNGDAFPQMTGKAKAENKFKSFAQSIMRKNLPFVGYIFAFGKWILAPFLGKPLEVVRSGHWYGNDTLWRAILDLNRILIYCDKDGVMNSSPQRRYIAIIDGIIAGEKNGPMAPMPKQCGIVAFSYNALLGDAVMSRLMGFDYNKIPSIREGQWLTEYMLADANLNAIIVHSNYTTWNKSLESINKEDCYAFTPAIGWEGHIELE